MNLVLILQLEEGSDCYSLVSDNDTGHFFLHALTVRKHCEKKLEPATVKGIRILLEQGHEDCALEFMKAIVPE